MFGNGICNDEANNAECNYDGGDCCVTPIELIGNGLCNDEANNVECYYDGGDCCKYLDFLKIMDSFSSTKVHTVCIFSFR